MRRQRQMCIIARGCIAGVRDGVPAVKCEWSKAAGAVRYDLYRQTGDAAPEKLWSGTDTTFVDHTVALETAYGYGVKAIDGAGRVIGFGGIVAVRCCPSGAE
jgi:fibronectin type 3 domain-containing protein